MEEEEDAGRHSVPVRVWDLPTRLFHWLLVALVATSFVTGKAGGNAMVTHAWSGSAILALLLFRGVWGFIGSGPSRFSSFLAGPGTVSRYALTLFRREAAPHLSHNPLGGWSVAAMLGILMVQAVTGLFADDDIAFAGPLAGWVGRAVRSRMTATHHLAQEGIIALVALHLAAVLFHLLYKRENLITPMITGVKQWRGELPGYCYQKPLGRALLAAAAAAGAVYLLVR
jgi:cytochrome b